MKNRWSSISALCLVMIALNAVAGSARTLARGEPEWLDRMLQDGWRKVQEGVLQRHPGASLVETFTYGEEGRRFRIRQLAERVGSLDREYATHPSAELARILANLKGELAGLEAGGSAGGRRSIGSEAFSAEAVEAGCEPAISVRASADPLPASGSPGVTARADASYHSPCGDLGNVYSYAYARAKNGTTTTVNIQEDPQYDGTSLDSTAAVSVNGTLDCYSEAYAQADSPSLGISYNASDTNFDCPGWRNGDVGAVGVAGSATQSGGTFTVQAGGTDLWDTADAFHFVHQTLTGDGEIVARVASLTNPAGANFTLGAVTFREALTAGSVHASMMITTQGKAKFRRRTVTGGTTASDGPSTGTTFPPRWLKLTRYGDVFEAFLSSDGVSWTQVHTPQTISMAPTVHVGFLALRSGSGAPAATATFDNVRIHQWQSLDVGAVGLAGGHSHSNGTFTIQAGGTDLWDTADAFHYVYQPLDGDGEIVARVASLTLPAGAAFTLAAVMIRETLTADARHASMLITTQGKAKFRRRTAVGGATESDGPSTGTTFPPRWLKLTRAGDTFTAYISSDGASWTQVHTPQTIPMAQGVYVGLAVLRNGSGAGQGTATIGNVTVVP